MEKRWKIKSVEEDRVLLLQQQLGIRIVFCKLLVQRGITSFEAAKDYFRPSLEQLHNPFLLKDMEKAIKRIDTAKAAGEKILIYGDYDVDGTTAVAVVYSFLRQHLPAIEFYIPHRYKEGYGVSQAGVDYAIQNGFSLIISLDCGIKSVGLVAYARQAGVDFIICDHHLPDEELPDAVAILNAKQPGCMYPFKELCGCGVGFKLIQALCAHWGLPDTYWQKYLDMVAIAIAADIVPIHGENRILTYFGLQQVNKSPSTGIHALLKRAGIAGEIHVSNLVFVIAPRVNAAGRMDDAKKAVELFICEDEAKANELADLLQIDNNDRKEIDLSITEQAIAMIENDPQLKYAKSTLLYHPDWGSPTDENGEAGKAKGVVGIVASRLIEKFYRPTIVLTDSGDKVAGSARSVHEFNVYEAIHACRDLLLSYGGHFYAAGLTLQKDKVALLKTKFEEVVSKNITEDMLVPEISIDAELHFSEVSLKLLDILNQMEPYGPENMRPVFISKRVYETGESKVVKDAHIKFSLMQDGVTQDGIGFGLAHKFMLLQPNVPIDVVYTLDKNVWNGNTTVQLRVIDLKPSMENTM